MHRPDRALFPSCLHTQLRQLANKPGKQTKAIVLLRDFANFRLAVVAVGTSTRQAGHLFLLEQAAADCRQAAPFHSDVRGPSFQRAGGAWQKFHHTERCFIMRTSVSVVIMLLMAALGFFVGSFGNFSVGGSILFAVIAGFACVIKALENRPDK